MPDEWPMCIVLASVIRISLPLKLIRFFCDEDEAASAIASTLRDKLGLGDPLVEFFYETRSQRQAHAVLFEEDDTVDICKRRDDLR